MRSKVCAVAAPSVGKSCARCLSLEAASAAGPAAAAPMAMAPPRRKPRRVTVTTFGSTRMPVHAFDG